MSFFPFCSDDVDDVPSFGFVAPHHSSWVGSMLHEFHCFGCFLGYSKTSWSAKRAKPTAIPVLPSGQWLLT